ncbi:MAG: thermonuclease family protein [Afipia sp.]
MNFRMPRRPQQRGSIRYNSDTRRWTVMVIVLIGSLGVYVAERWLRFPDAPIVGNAFVADGDTLTISGMRIRLVDIDAPELDQSCLDAQGRDWPCGRQASAQLRSRVRGRDLKCQPRSLDKFGRTLATCTLPDGTDVNAWMVQQGWAVTYGFADVYGTQQDEAKSAKRGLWAGSFTPPREWRQQHPRADNARKD